MSFDIKRDPGAAILSSLNSPNEADSNGETANVVDGLFAIARAISHLAGVIEDIRDAGKWEFGGKS